MTDNTHYEAPAVREIGTIAELTEQLNKVGTRPDVLSSVPVPGGPVVGSFVNTGR